MAFCNLQNLWQCGSGCEGEIDCEWGLDHASLRLRQISSNDKVSESLILKGNFVTP